MRVSLRTLLPVGVALLALALPGLCPILSAQSTSLDAANGHKLLYAREKEFDQFNQDFLEFAKSVEASTHEYEVAYDLLSIASETEDALDAASTSLEIYTALSCQEDRAAVSPRIYLQLSHLSQEAGSSVSEANLDIASTRRPGVAEEASRMRDALREVKSTLDSIRLRAKPN